MSSMTDSVSSVSLVVGVIELVTAAMSVIIGAIAVTSYSGHASASTGIWAFAFLFPGVMSIVAARTNSVLILTYALFFNIVATVVSSVATFICISFWIVLTHLDRCNCQQYGFGCDSHNKVFTIIVAMTIVMVILTITGFTGCVIGCAGTCCGPSDPVIITTVPIPRATVIISSQASTQTQPNYHPMLPQNTAGSMFQAYTGVPVQTFGFEKLPQSVPETDDQPLADNIVL